VTLDINPTWIRPRYGSGCFADLPRFIAALLGEPGPSPLTPTGFERLPQRYQQVVFIFLDAFGWSFFERFRERSPFLRRIEQAGSVTKLTSQFPSTTSAHVTTLLTGLSVGQHGVFEWNYYEPQLDSIITPLLFSFAGDKTPGTLQAAGARPEDILPAESLGQRLQSSGAATYAFLHQSYAASPYNAIVNRNDRLTPYKTFPEALVNLRQRLESQQNPAFYFLYFDAIDSICHDYGPDSPHVEAEIEACLAALTHWLERGVRTAGDTLLLITADHGQTAVDPTTAIYLNQLPDFARLEPLLRRNGRGQLLVPAGSPRDMFLYIEDGHVDEAQGLLSRWLAGRADVARVADLIAQGFFGPLPVSDSFRARVGDLVILPHRSESVWWYEKDRFEQRFYGHHGGLSADEMEIPLLLLALP
jgi:predicted AlkP superfamily pyrophosphatase or phosphodiesterase